MRRRFLRPCKEHDPKYDCLDETERRLDKSGSHSIAKTNAGNVSSRNSVDSVAIFLGFKRSCESASLDRCVDGIPKNRTTFFTGERCNPFGIRPVLWVVTQGELARLATRGIVWNAFGGQRENICDFFGKISRIHPFPCWKGTKEPVYGPRFTLHV